MDAELGVCFDGINLVCLIFCGFCLGRVFRFVFFGFDFELVSAIWCLFSCPIVLRFSEFGVAFIVWVCYGGFGTFGSLVVLFVCVDLLFWMIIVLSLVSVVWYCGC